MVKEPGALVYWLREETPLLKVVSLNPSTFTGWTLSTWICCKNCNVCLKSTENKLKRGREWPILRSGGQFYLLKRLIEVIVQVLRRKKSRTTANVLLKLHSQSYDNFVLETDRFCKLKTHNTEASTSLCHWLASKQYKLYKEVLRQYRRTVWAD